ncbi:hypothetical protein D1872_311100 [compost metagenome]
MITRDTVRNECKRIRQQDRTGGGLASGQVHASRNAIQFANQGVSDVSGTAVVCAGLFPGVRQCRGHPAS